MEAELHPLAAHTEQFYPGTKPPRELPKVEGKKEYKTNEGVTIYADSVAQAQKLLSVIRKHQRLFTEIPGHAKTDEPMRIDLIPGWEKVKIPTKVYPLSAKNREVVDETFDKLHQQGRLKWADRNTPFGFPVFVSWRNAIDPNTGKSYRNPRAVVDIRGLNKITIPDSYPLPRQEDIINAVKGKKYVTVADAS